MFYGLILLIIKYHKLEVGRFHSLAFLKLLLSEFSISLTRFSVLERAVSVDVKIITIGVVQIVILNTLKHKPVSLASPGGTSFYLSWWISKFVERKI